MYTHDLALNNLQGWYAIKPNQPTLYNLNIYAYQRDLALNNIQGLNAVKPYYPTINNLSIYISMGFGIKQSTRVDMS